MAKNKTVIKEYGKICSEFALISVYTLALR